MTEQSATPTEAGPQDQTVMITRVFDAPRDLVFKAWTDPDHLTQWSGPEGFHTPRETVEIDLRTGGRFHLGMLHDDSGEQYPVHFEIIEINEPELIVLKGAPMPEMGMPEPTITRIELHDHGGKTRISLTEGPYTTMMRGPAEDGWNQSFDKLDALLPSL